MQGSIQVQVEKKSDISLACKVSNEISTSIGFDQLTIEKIALSVSELASNLVKYTGGGKIIFTKITKNDNEGIKIESIDNGPGIVDVELAITDGYSTINSLGIGLGTVNRIMDEFKIESRPGLTHIVGIRWIRVNKSIISSPLSFAVASQPRIGMTLNGDTFVMKRWRESALVGVIDGVGHGQWAHRAAISARRYIEEHYDQPLEHIFMGTGRVCRSTRGVVMALARFDWLEEKLTFASIGNIAVRVIGSPEKMNFIIRRGIIGINAPKPVICETKWNPTYIMILQSDGLTSNWGWDDFPHLKMKPASELAYYLLKKLRKEEDDSTILVVRGII